MKTFRAYQAEILKLQAKAEAARQREIKGVVAHIRELITEHGLTRQDLGLGDGDAPARGRRAKSGKTVGVARYRDPATGKTWTGRGKPPAWIAGAKDRSAFEIGASSAPASFPMPGKAAKKVARKAAKKAAAKPAKPAGKARKVAAKAPAKVARKVARTAVNKAASKVAKPMAGKKPAKAPAKVARKVAKPAKAPRQVSAPEPAPAPAPDNANG